MRKSRYRIDKDGVLWHEGIEVREPNVTAFFLRGLRRAEDGRLVVMCAGDENEIVADDTPYVVRNVVFEGEAVTLLFAGNYRETLDPSTLRRGDPGVLYARVRHGAFEARFTRHASVKLSEKIVETPNGPALRLGKHEWPLAGRNEE